MSTHPDPTNFFADFLEDYFAECEDHLTVVRRELLAIEPFVGKQKIERSILNELFRSFHSLKGLSGMVGVKDAEELAHEMESYLRVLRDQEVMLSPQGFDALLGGTKGLEQTIASHRNKTASPDIKPAIASLRAVIPQTEPEPSVVEESRTPKLQLKAEEITHLERAVLAPGAIAWHFIFVPTPQLSNNGINVNKIRDRLQSLGELIYAAPRMTREGKIEFDFLIVSSMNVSAFRGWENDGLAWSPYLDSSSPETEQTPPGLPQSPEPAPPDSTPTPSVEPRAASEPEPAKSGEINPKTEREETPTPVLALTPTAPLMGQSSNVVRVDLPKLDELMRMMGDLVITRARLEDSLTRMKEKIPLADLRPLIEINQILERQLRDLREGVMRVRLVPIGEIFARMQFVVRDLVRETQKQVRVEFSGQETEIDKFVVERMMDPLLHLVRNAVSHGLETIEERQKADKPIEGKIALRARTCGEMVVIEIEDDGIGIDQPKVMERAYSRGLLPNCESRNLLHQGYDPTTILEILCTPGFSTRDVADLASGRGVGMAIVKNTIQELGGTLTLESTSGQGTRFIIELPLTLAIADAFLVSVCRETYAIPQSSVREAIALSSSAVTVFEQTEMIPYRGRVIPLLRLESLFDLTPLELTPSDSRNRQQSPLSPRANSSPPVATESPGNPAVLTRQPSRFSGKDPSKTHSSLRIVIVGSGPSTVGIAVDRIIGQQEIVVRPLNDPFVQVLGISGATEIGDGRVILILDAPALVRTSNPK
ncbi:chemotaxis protein CheA [Laspinema olomoucense]|uniref:chemotaxis protein CheA n=1 Tax=Laspinema olomoucense TaxID=3231600 RepID=UPI0021BA5145|nr:chemotaxis protein CheA [Laspinema sp. D3a]MCT7988221.1 chemotaxis protein CheA [Laspinema sp. D3a]